MNNEDLIKTMGGNFSTFHCRVTGDSYYNDDFTFSSATCGPLYYECAATECEFYFGAGYDCNCYPLYNI